MARILVVDDEESIREILCACLEGLGHETTTAGSGVEALARFREKRFDLVLSDVIMDDMNGFQLLKALQPSLGDAIPFVILSSHSDPAAIEAAIYAGAFDYLVKPFDAAAVQKVVESALAAAGSGGIPEAQPCP